MLKLLYYFATTTMIIALILSADDQRSEIELLKKMLETAPVALAETDIIPLIDQRVEVLEKRKSKARLAEVSSVFEPAAQSTPDSRLMYGNPGARITLQEFGDIECPYCRKMHGDLKKVVDGSEGVVAWEFKHFPLQSHNPAAAMQAKAVECAKELHGNRVAWAVLDRFIESTGGNGAGVGDIPGFVRSLGLPGPEMDTCLASRTGEARIDADYAEGRSYGITGTPAVRILDRQTGRDFLVKGYKSAEQLLQAIQQVLRS